MNAYSAYSNVEPEDVYSRFQRQALLAEEKRRMREYQDLASKDAIFKLKIIGALVAFGMLVSMGVIG